MYHYINIQDKCGKNKLLRRRHKKNIYLTLCQTTKSAIITYHWLHWNDIVPKLAAGNICSWKLCTTRAQMCVTHSDPICFSLNLSVHYQYSILHCNRYSKSILNLKINIVTIVMFYKRNLRAFILLMEL